MYYSDIAGSKPTQFTSDKTYRDAMNLDDIVGSRPMVMKGYSGAKKEYEKSYGMDKLGKHYPLISL